MKGLREKLRLEADRSRYLARAYVVKRLSEETAFLFAELDRIFVRQIAIPWERPRRDRGPRPGRRVHRGFEGAPTETMGYHGDKLRGRPAASFSRSAVSSGAGNLPNFSAMPECGRLGEFSHISAAVMRGRDLFGRRVLVLAYEAGYPGSSETQRESAARSRHQSRESETPLWPKCGRNAGLLMIPSELRRDETDEQIIEHSIANFRSNTL